MEISKEDEYLFDWSRNPVLRFIDKFYSQNGNNDEARETLRRQFRAGYCYYFAHMLKVAFNRGEVCWCTNVGHIVWVDDDGTPYDIEGINDSECEYYIPEKYLGDYIEGFKRVKETDYPYPKTEEEANSLTKKIIENYLKDISGKETNLFNKGKW